MKHPHILAAVVAVAALTLTGCTAAPVTATTAEPVAVVTPTPTPTPTATDSTPADMTAFKDAVSKLSPEKQDELYLAATRKSITTGTDSDLITVGRKVCTDFAAGADMNARVADVTAAGFASTDSLAIIITAGMIYCKA